jgi:tRNA A58 N-methylase Trm61
MEKLTLDKLPQEVLAKIDLETAFMASRLVVAAERFQIFRKLHGKRLCAVEIGEILKIHETFLRVFLNALVSMGLLEKEGDTYWNSALTEKYFVEERSVYWTRQFSKECVEAYEAYSVLEKVLGTGEVSCAVERANKKNYLETMKRDRDVARDFTQMLFHSHKAESEALANALDLRGSQAILDVGGGSGIMSMALVKKNPHIRACVMDIESVCRVALENINNAGLASRMSVLPGDFHAGLPDGFDVILFCDIGRIPREIVEESFKCLTSGGKIVLVDRFISEDRTEPLNRLLYQLEGSGFGTETKEEIIDLLKDCGFQKTSKDKLINDVWVITGMKMDAP